MSERGVDIAKLEDRIARLEKEQQRGWAFPIIYVLVLLLMAALLYFVVLPDQIFFPLIMVIAAVFMPFSWAFIRPRNVKKSLARLRKERADFLSNGLRESQPLVMGDAEDPDGPVILNGYKSCPMCAERIRFEARKCRFCGEMVDANGV